MIKIRLDRQGSKKRTFYRIVAAPEEKKRTAGLEIIGIWDPKKNQKRIDKNKLDKWLSVGAKMTPGAAKILSQK